MSVLLLQLSSSTSAEGLAFSDSHTKNVQGAPPPLMWEAVTKGQG